MKGKSHEMIGFYTLIIFTFLFFYLSLDTFLTWERLTLWFLIVTYFLNPDSDTQSSSAKHLGIFKYIFLPLKHRGISHSPLLWLGVFALCYYRGCVPEGIGALSAAVLHLVCDGLSTGFKRLNPL